MEAVSSGVSASRRRECKVLIFISNMPSGSISELFSDKCSKKASSSSMLTTVNSKLRLFFIPINFFKDWYTFPIERENLNRA